VTERCTPSLTLQRDTSLHSAATSVCCRHPEELKRRFVQNNAEVVFNNGSSRLECCRHRDPVLTQSIVLVLIIEFNRLPLLHIPIDR